MMKCGLLGRKLGHSYSPQIHAHLGAYPYTLFEREPEDVEAFLQNGDFTAEELQSAKQSLLSQLRSTHDTPGAIEGYYATSALSGLGLTPADYMRAVEEASAEDVAEAAKRIRLHTVYFLRGAL